MGCEWSFLLDFCLLLDLTIGTWFLSGEIWVFR